MKQEEFEHRFDTLIAADDLEAAEKLLASMVEEAPAPPHAAPLTANAQMRFDPDPAQPQPEGFDAIKLVTRYSRRLRNARYRRMIRRKPDRLRVVSEGDSWFQYPVLLQDLIDHVNRDFAVYSLGYPGDTLEGMLQHGEYLSAIDTHKPDVFMFSAGGNDVLGGGELTSILNPYFEGAEPADLINAEAWNTTLRNVMIAYRKVISSALELRPGMRIFVHGYGNGYVRNNGEKFGIPFEKMNIPIDLGRKVIRLIVGRFNDALLELADRYPRQVTHFDLRDEIGDHANSWHDEIHPKSAAFGKAAAPLISALHDLERRRDELRSQTPESAVAHSPVAEATNVTAGRRGIYADLQARANASVTPPRDDLRPNARHAEEVAEAQRQFEALVHAFDLPEPPDLVETRLDYSLRAGRHRFERIIGDNNFDEYYVLSRGAAAGKAVARIHVRGPGGGSSFGTGFLIGGNLLMTNNHVLPERNLAATSIATFDYEFDVDGTLKSSVHFALTDEVFLTSVENDYTIVSVSPTSSSGHPLGEYGSIQMLPRSGKALKKEYVNIIQHPLGDYKKVALRENLVVGRSEQFLYYATDTQAGSSGSPVFNEEWQMAALHHMAIPDPNNPGSYRANRGVRISAIMDDITRQRNAGSSDAIRIDAMLQAIRTGEHLSPAPAQPQPCATPPAPVSAPPAPAAVRLPDLGMEPDNDEDWAEALEGETSLLPQPEAARPPLPVTAAHWPSSPTNAPDTWHLPIADADGGCTLNADLITAALQTSGFAPDTQASGKLIIGLRGARLASGASRAENQTAIAIETTTVDHENTRCLMGVLDLQSGRLSMYQGSTVPRRTGMQRYYNKINFGASGANCNMLPTGCYEYCVGTHYSQSKGPVKYVLRQGNGPNPANSATVTTLRTTNDLCYGTQDIWDRCRPGDNIHPSFRNSSFSSLGCLTVPGTQSGNGASHTTGTGDWRRFRQAAGFDGVNYEMRYDLLLLTGHEMVSLAQAMDGSGSLEDLRCLRHGSSGDAVRRLQTALGIGVDGDFGPTTKKHLTQAQTQTLGYATGTYSPKMAGLLGFTF